MNTEVWYWPLSNEIVFVDICTKTLFAILTWQDDTQILEYSSLEILGFNKIGEL